MSRTWVVLAMIAAAAPARAEAPSPDDAALYACRPLGPNTRITASFKPDVSVAELATWVTSFTCKDVVFASDVARTALTVTMLTPRPMTPKQAVALFVDAVQTTGLVVMTKPDRFLIKRGPKMSAPCTPVPADPAAADPLGATNPPPDFRRGIQVVSPTHIRITRATIHAMMADHSTLEKGARVVPAVKDGKPNGIKFYAIRPTSVFGYFGFANGDTLHDINGVALTDPERALEAYAKLRDETDIRLAITRRGARITLVIDVVDQL